MLALIVAVVSADDPEPVAPEGSNDADKDGLSFIDEGKTVKKLGDVSSFTPNVMIHNDARDVLRKLVKEKETAFFVQFYKGAPDRELREDVYKYDLIAKSDECYEYSDKYEYSEIDVDNALYKDLVDNLSFKKKFENNDFPYLLYTYQGKGYMVHGPGAAREVFDLRGEVEKAAKKDSVPDDCKPAAPTT